MPTNDDCLTAETEIPHPTLSAPLVLQVERKIQSGFLNKPEKLGPAAGQVGPGLSNIGAADVCSFSDSTGKSIKCPFISPLKFAPALCLDVN